MLENIKRIYEKLKEVKKEKGEDLSVAYSMVRAEDYKNGVRDFTELEKAWDTIKSFEVEISKMIKQGDMEALEEFCKIIESGDIIARNKFREKWV